MGQRNIIGLVADRDLAELFNSVGYQVVGGPDFQSAAKRIGDSEFPPALIVVVDQQAPGFGPWIEQQAMHVPVRIIPSTDGSLGAHAFALPLPSSPASILSSLGLQFSGVRADEPIGVDGTIGAGVTAPVVVPQPISEPVALVGDPDFVAEPIPTLSDDEAPTPSDASFSVQSCVPSSSRSGVTPQPAWLSQVAAPTDISLSAGQSPANAGPVTHPAPAQPEPWSAQAPIPAPSVPWGQQAASHPEAQPQLPGNQPGNWGAPSPQPQLQQYWGQAPVPVETPSQSWQQPQSQPQWSPEQPYRAPYVTPDVVPIVQAPGFQEVSAPAQHYSPEPAWQQQPGSFHDQRSNFMQQSTNDHTEACVLISWAAKGGVGKTSVTIATAQVAGEAGLKVLVIDANRGQASVRHNLRVTGLPSIYDARTGGAHQAVVTKDMLMSRRPPARGPIHFDVILGPPEDYAGAENTPAALYASVLGEVRRSYDLIVIDTQILEAEGDMTDMWVEFLVPQLRGGGWGVGIFDESPTGLDHLDERLTMLNGRFGISNSRMLAVSNMWEQFTEDDAAHVAQLFAGRAMLLGSIENDASFRDRLTAGFIPTDATGVTPVIRQLLHQITGRPQFQLIEQEPSRVSRLFRRRKK